MIAELTPLPELIQAAPGATRAVGELAIARVRAPALDDLVLELGVGAHREVQDVDRAVVDAPPELWPLDSVVALHHRDLRVGAVSNLGRQRLAQRVQGLALAKGHALPEWAFVL